MFNFYHDLLSMCHVQCCYFNKDSDFHFVRVGVTAVNIAYILFSDDGLFKVPHLG